ncbi:MAG: hypothetical protein AAF039_02705 [Bacteroidota bacterium]
MKPLFTFLFVCFCSGFFCFSQEGEKLLQAPSDWRYEQLKLPLPFAPSIPLKGYEEVYFAPGWDNPESEAFWTYAFAWILEEAETIEKVKMVEYLTAYYDGLMKVVGQFNTVETTISLKSTSNGYEGKVQTLDGFFTKDTIHLNLTIEKQSEGKLWLFRLSPKDREHPVWEILNTIKLAN